MHLFYTTDESIFIRLDMSKNKKLGNQGGNMFDITPHGRLIGCSTGDNMTIK